MQYAISNIHHPMTISGQLINIQQRRAYPAEITIAEGKIISIKEMETAPHQYILPGFTDAHVHIESSMLVPTEFAKLAVEHGTVATVSDPHEIANVCGMEGVRYMIRNAKQTALKIFFGAPSCVPATNFETAGATLDSKAVDELLGDENIWYLSEMMNYPGVLFDDAEVLAKIAAAKKHNKPVDGHAPGVHGKDAEKYIAAGISTDHECTTLEEALDKLSYGMKILIREGSAAKNFEALHSLLKTHPGQTMLCSDDKHPDDLMIGHINLLVKRALSKGYDLYDVLQAACINPVLHYKLPVGLLRENDPADFIVMDSIAGNVLQTYINGVAVYDQGKVLLPDVTIEPINQFEAQPIDAGSLKIPAAHDMRVRVIDALDGQLITRESEASLKVVNGFLESDTAQDVLKMVVLNRYEAHAKPALAFIRNFGLKTGAIASTVAHDCHNIIAVGVDDESIAAAINKIIEYKSGIAVARNKSDVSIMPLPIAGLMSDQDGITAGKQYAALTEEAKALGSQLHAPFMTLSFMALLVIPQLKLSDKGLFDGGKFEFVDLVK